MSLTALQAATIITCHEYLTKFLVTGAFRLYSWLGPNDDSYKKSRVIRDLCSAQMNVSEYSAFMAAPLFYLSAMDIAVSSMALALTVVGQVGYFWARVLDGYPKVPVATLATVRYLGFGMICHQLVGLAFP